MQTRMEDNTVIHTEYATAIYQPARDSDGRNLIDRNTRSQWIDQTLYRSRKGRYYILTVPRIQGQMPHGEWLSPEQAAAWIALNDCEMPAELVAAAEACTE